jgi:nicotinamide-nucleotide amidase
MTAEIISVGTELLLGDILNSNAQFLAQQLASLGIAHYHQNVVGDNIQRIHQVIDTAIKRSKILIFTGGLGPTPDDLTTEAIALYFQTPLIEHPEIIADITAKYAQRGRIMTPSNRKQALLPQGANVLPNPAGTAPGIIWNPQGEIIIFTFPGVPSEMIRMWTETAVPYLKNQGISQDIIYSQTLRFWGIPEAALAEKVTEFFNLQNPTVAPYASKGEVKLRLSAKAKNTEAAIALIQPIAEQIKQIAGLDYYGSDQDSLPSVIGQLLTEKNQTLAVAESCTGGKLGEMITNIAGSSNYFTGGVIAYSNQVKRDLLAVNAQDLEQFGAVSEIVAKQMAQGVKKVLNTDWGIGITGIAGPGGGTEEKPVGLVYIGIAGNEGVESVKYQFHPQQNRDLIRHVSALNALDLLRRKIGL